MRQEIKEAREIVRRALEATELDTTNLAKEAGCSASTLTRLMGDNPKSAPTYKTVRQVKEAVKRLTGHVIQNSENSTSSISSSKDASDIASDRVSIPEYNVQVSAGDGFNPPSYEMLKRNWEIPRNFINKIPISNIDNLAIVTVYGESMEPDYHPYDKILVDTGDTVVRHDGAYVISHEDNLMVKMLQIRPPKEGGEATLLVISKNKDYPPYERGISEVDIKGRVIGKWDWR